LLLRNGDSLSHTPSKRDLPAVHFDHEGSRERMARDHPERFALPYSHGMQAPLKATAPMQGEHGSRVALF